MGLPGAGPMIAIAPIALAQAAGFHDCLDSVAGEKRYLAKTQALPLERIEGFVRDSVANHAMRFDGVYYDAEQMSLLIE